MKVLESTVHIQDTFQNFFCGEAKIGLVSTLGHIHDGHLSLIRKAKTMSDAVAVNVFANPVLLKDPLIVDFFKKNRQTDIDLLENEGVDYVFFASLEDIFPEGHKTFVRPESLIDSFREIETEEYLTTLATTYFKLLNLFHPTFILVGKKNFIDFLILKQMVQDYCFSTEVVLCPTVRDESGLPYSSFQDFFTPEQKLSASKIYEALRTARRILMEGEKIVSPIIQTIESILKADPLINVKFIGVVEPNTFEAIDNVEEQALIMIAAEVGRFRVIDNIIFRRDSD